MLDEQTLSRLPLHEQFWALVDHEVSGEVIAWVKTNKRRILAELGLTKQDYQRAKWQQTRMNNLQRDRTGCEEASAEYSRLLDRRRAMEEEIRNVARMVNGDNSP